MREVTRLAPSPTGALHLGNARTFLVNFLLARQGRWQVRLRVEDLDGPRLKKGADRQALEDLRWLGISWDSGPDYQSATPERYAAAAERLVASGHAYPCTCTRSEVDSAASAPHSSDGAAAYPGTCRGKYETVEAARSATGRNPCLRFKIGSGEFTYVDGFAGARRFILPDLGDFVIQKADGTPAYQLACALDDAETGVTQVVRGDDLLESVPRQILLMRALGFGDRVPRYSHLPLVVGADGRRLAKRHGDTRLASYRSAGVSVGRILALMARWLGMPEREYGSAAEMVADFEIGRMSREQVVMSEADELMIRGGRGTLR